ncbi:MAG: class I SAM-dependent methyltransferase [Proteobacteria bacterium]|nr:class I SAM-dependent methyltransferase [Pseudomonadota bacterium]MDA0982929.1 class I SAM-dependent methyltransferase [Pseudomonadota bacterium]
MKALHLKAGRERSVQRRHPWIFSGAIERVDGTPEPGETLLVKNAGGQPMAVAAWSAESQIRARIWSFDPKTRVEAPFFAAVVAGAVMAREALPAARHTNALRLVHGESDGLPGVIVDRYADVLVAQFLSAGAERWREAILDALAAATGCEAIYERSDAEVRGLEGLQPRTGFVRGNHEARRCPIVEHGLNFRVDVEAGQKTGFFLDQRDNRQRIRALAAGREVLDAFCYTGGFALSALAGSAKRVLALDSSAPALEVARENLDANALDASRIAFEQVDVFAQQRKLRDAGAKFDLVILDPPKFAPTAAQAKNAARAYKDINLLAFKLLAPGGLLATFSCSGGVSAELFQSIVAGAAADAGVGGRVIERFHGGADHPVALSFPEGDYLKGLLISL